jgi:hypothetical protein
MSVNDDQPTKEIVTVSEMARMLGLSRARFYQLVSEGVFLVPSRNPKTGRPFYSREQQEQCREIRRTNRGANGQTILFYSTAPKSPPAPKRAKPAKQTRPSAVPASGLLDRLRDGLGQLGVRDVPDAKLRAALVEVCPTGHDGVEPAALLTAVYRCLKRRNTQDNVAG